MPRLDRILASLGYGSRKEVRGLVADGKVAVQGAIAKDPGTQVEPGAVTVEGEPLDHPTSLLLLMNKPLGRVCSQSVAEGPRVIDLLPERWRARNPTVTTVGRLDKETTGVLLLTDLPEIVHRLTSPKRKVAKVYRALLDRPPPKDSIETFASGRLLLAGETLACAPAEMRIIGDREAECVLTEGRYHQVRRMFAAVGCTVLALHRARFGPFDESGLAPGEWREIDFKVLLDNGLYP